MAEIKLTIPDVVLPRVIDGICKKFNYDIRKLEGETKAQFSKRMLVQHVKQWIKDVEGAVPFVEAHSTKNSIEQDIENNISIT